MTIILDKHFPRRQATMNLPDLMNMIECHNNFRGNQLCVLFAEESFPLSRLTDDVGQIAVVAVLGTQEQVIVIHVHEVKIQQRMVVDSLTQCLRAFQVEVEMMNDHVLIHSLNGKQLLIIQVLSVLPRTRQVDIGIGLSDPVKHFEIL